MKLLTQLLNVGIARYCNGDVDEAVPYYEQALALGKAIDYQAGVSRALHSLALAYHDRLQLEKAAQLYEEALAPDRTLDRASNMDSTLGNIGLVQAEIGNLPLALTYQEEARHIAEEGGNQLTRGNHLNNIGLIYAYLGQYDQARIYMEEAIAIAESSNNAHRISFYNIMYANLLANMGHVDRALTLAHRSLELATATAVPETEIEYRLWYAIICLIANETRMARDMLAPARRIDLTRFSYNVAVMDGIAAAALAEIDDARQAFIDAIAAASAILEHTPNFWRARYALALSQAGMAWLAANGQPTPDALSAADWLATAEQSYQLARQNCDGAGVLRDQRRYLAQLVEANGGGILRPLLAILD